MEKDPAKTANAQNYEKSIEHEIHADLPFWAITRFPWKRIVWSVRQSNATASRQGSEGVLPLFLRYWLVAPLTAPQLVWPRMTISFVFNAPIQNLIGECTMSTNVAETWISSAKSILAHFAWSELVNNTFKWSPNFVEFQALRSGHNNLARS